MNNEIIKLSKISKKFVGVNKDIIVLKNVNLKINKGELVSLTGPSGSGKSTLLHIIALLDQPTSGEVFFKKKSFTKSNDNNWLIIFSLYQVNMLGNNHSTTSTPMSDMACNVFIIGKNYLSPSHCSIGTFIKSSQSTHNIFGPF